MLAELPGSGCYRTLGENMPKLIDEYPNLTLSDYQEQAEQTAIYPMDAVRFYPALGLAGEAGEVANKIKKELRDGVPVDKEVIAAELGDVLWYIALLCRDYNLDLGYVATKNLDKLFDRQQRGVLGGSGDAR
jgi:NTP pyrophosphatase (non-canonical NTP hydrolase)